MSDYGLFDAIDHSEGEQRLAAARAVETLDRAVHAVGERFGALLAAARDRDDFNDRVALVKNDMLKVVAEHLMPKPGVMRRVVASQRPDFAARERVAARVLPDYRRWAGCLVGEAGSVEYYAALFGLAASDSEELKHLVEPDAHGELFESPEETNPPHDAVGIEAQYRAHAAGLVKMAPFADYKDFADCVAKNKQASDPEAYCGSIKHQVEDAKVSFTDPNWGTLLDLTTWEDNELLLALTYPPDAGSEGWEFQHEIEEEARRRGLTAARVADIALSVGDHVRSGWGDLLGTGTVTDVSGGQLTVRWENGSTSTDPIAHSNELTKVSATGDPLIPKNDWKGYLRARGKGAREKVRRNFDPKSKTTAERNVFYEGGPCPWCGAPESQIKLVADPATNPLTGVKRYQCEECLGNMPGKGAYATRRRATRTAGAGFVWKDETAESGYLYGRPESGGAEEDPFAEVRPDYDDPPLPVRADAFKDEGDSGETQYFASVEKAKSWCEQKMLGYGNGSQLGLFGSRKQSYSLDEFADMAGLSQGLGNGWEVLHGNGDPILFKAFTDYNSARVTLGDWNWSVTTGLRNVVATGSASSAQEAMTTAEEAYRSHKSARRTAQQHSDSRGSYEIEDLPGGGVFVYVEPTTGDAEGREFGSVAEAQAFAESVLGAPSNAPGSGVSGSNPHYFGSRRTATDWEAVGYDAYQTGQPGAPTLNSQVFDAIIGLPVGGGAVEIMQAYTRGYERGKEEEIMREFPEMYASRPRHTRTSTEQNPTEIDPALSGTNDQALSDESESLQPDAVATNPHDARMRARAARDFPELRVGDTRVDPTPLPDDFDNEGGRTDLEPGAEDTTPHDAARRTAAGDLIGWWNKESGSVWVTASRDQTDVVQRLSSALNESDAYERFGAAGYMRHDNLLSLGGVYYTVSLSAGTTARIARDFPELAVVPPFARSRRADAVSAWAVNPRAEAEAPDTGKHHLQTLNPTQGSRKTAQVPITPNGRAGGIRHVAGWRWDHRLSGYVAQTGVDSFDCTCGARVAAPSFRACGCGKSWNVYSVSTPEGQRMIAREVPVRGDAILAGRT